MKFTVFQKEDGLWYWELHTEEGSVVATTSRGAADLSTALTIIAEVKSGIKTAQIAELPDGNLHEPVATVI